MTFQFYTGITFSQLATFPEDAMVSLSTQPKSSGGYHARPSAASLECARALGLSSAGRRLVDGSGFSQISAHGRWTWDGPSHEARMAAVERGIGAANIDGYFTQDWMCEPEIVAGTGLTVEEHQRRTVASGVELERLNARREWIHTVQGYSVSDYVRCIEMYRDAGIDLTQRRRVAVGSVCKRQGTREGPAIMARMVRALAPATVHALGFNILGLATLCGLLAPSEWARVSADSASWSARAKHDGILMHGHKHGGAKVAARAYSAAEWERLWSGDRFDGQRWPNCANCTVFALHERARILSKVDKRWYWNADLPFAS